MTDALTQLAMAAFNAYNEQGPNPWKTFDGRDVPRWEQLSDQVRAKWMAAASMMRASNDSDVRDAAVRGARITKAVGLAVTYGGIDGDHHKAWVIDQMVRVLAGDAYFDVVRAASAGKDGPETYQWKVGIAP